MGCVKPHMREALKDHVLEEFPAGGRIRAFYLRKPDGGRMMSTLILFTPDGIVICGDLNPHPTGRAAASCFGYGLPWFASELDEGYLCSKFLEKEWVNGYAADHCREAAREALKGGRDLDTEEMGRVSEERRARLDDLLMIRRLGGDRDVKEWAREDYWRQTRRLRALRAALAERYGRLAADTEEWGYGWERFADELRQIDPRACDDGVPGVWYPPGAAGWLCAIQRRFAELHRAKVAAQGA